jgi:hypothetical protein
LDGLTRSSSPEPNGRARASVVVGLLAVLLIPAAVVASEFVQQVTLLDAGVAVPVAALLGIAAIVLARRAREQVRRTLGRIGGQRVAAVGKALGVLALAVAGAAAVALGFFGLLTLFAS